MAQEDFYRYPLPQGPANLDGERATISLITMRSPINDVRTLTLTGMPAMKNNDIIIRRASKRASKGDYRTPAADNSCYESQVVSREHAYIMFDPDTKDVMLKDNYSTHGTWLNGRQLRSGGLERMSNHCYIRCGVDVVRGVETFPALVLEVIIHWADDPNYHTYFPLVKSHFDHAHKWGPHTTYGEHQPALTSSNTFCVPDDSDSEDVPENAHVEELPAHDSDLELIHIEKFLKPRMVAGKWIGMIDASTSATGTDRADTCLTKSVTGRYPSSTYPESSSCRIGLGSLLNSNSDESSELAVELQKEAIIVPPVENDSEDDSEEDVEEDIEEDVESDSDESEYPEDWIRSRSDDETEDIDGESYHEDDSDGSEGISEGPVDSDDEPELEASEHGVAMEYVVNPKYIDPGLLIPHANVPISAQTTDSDLSAQMTTVSSPNTSDHVKIEESKEVKPHIQLPDLEDNSQVCPVNAFYTSPSSRYPMIGMSTSCFPTATPPIQYEMPSQTIYTDGPFQCSVAAKGPSSGPEDLAKPPCVPLPLKRKASKMEANDHEDKIVISATEPPNDTNLKQSEVVNAITSALSESEPEPAAKRVKTSHSPSSNIATHATTAFVSAVLGALGTIALLAALPTEYFQ